MPNANCSFSPSRVDQLKQQLKKLEILSQSPVDIPALEQFDRETEKFLERVDGEDSQMAAYTMSTMAEAEALLNIPESAQEPTSRDLLQKSIQQRRQMLMGPIVELKSMEEKEAEVLTGEIRKDLPGPM